MQPTDLRIGRLTAGGREEGTQRQDKSDEQEVPAQGHAAKTRDQRASDRVPPRYAGLVLS